MGSISGGSSQGSSAQGTFVTGWQWDSAETADKVSSGGAGAAESTLASEAASDSKASLIAKSPLSKLARNAANDQSLDNKFGTLNGQRLSEADENSQSNIQMNLKKLEAISKGTLFGLETI